MRFKGYIKTLNNISSGTETAEGGGKWDISSGPLVSKRPRVK